MGSEPLKRTFVEEVKGEEIGQHEVVVTVIGKDEQSVKKFKKDEAVSGIHADTEASSEKPDADVDAGPDQPKDDDQESKSYSPPGLIGIDKLEQIYNFSDDSEDDDDLQNHELLGEGADGHNQVESEQGERPSTLQNGGKGDGRAGDYEDDDGDDVSDDESDDEEDSLEPWQEAIIDEMEKSVEYPLTAETSLDGEPLITLPKDVSSMIRTELWKNGPIKFMDKFSGPGSEYPPEQVLAALGFRLPIKVASKYSKPQLTPFIRLAIRYTLSSRQRLAYPHTLDDLCQVLKNAKKVIVLTGAGISTSLGIPDFRSESGLYNKLAFLGLNDPQEVFDIALFREDPSIFYSVAKDILPETSKFSPTHAFIKLLQDKGILLRNYTQNIDNLESYAGIDAEKLVQCHGSFATATCVTCGFKTEGEEIFPDIRNGNVPKCPQCQVREKEKNKPAKAKINDSDEDEEDVPKSEGVLKPDITFFGEALPTKFEELLLGGDAHDCDLLICIGTSLKVAPVSEIVRILPPDIPQIYISKTAVHHNEFDITFLGNCDDAVELIVEKMGWSLDHEMTRRHTLDAKQIEGSDDLVYPDGRIIFEDTEAVYRFESDEKKTESKIVSGELITSTESAVRPQEGTTHDADTDR
ncbi:histone deacetylase HST1 [Sugiyamaella lignohabitans]|uniref:Histone deacetylase HST1 n=1 Tax=Sugiyamaella lignohabitans TaxID=796027 RepID=A0A167D863_9ASCO|nr:histone deacetylase HST1 [Sugiyamaella lignohabitans]ANB12599.1 histone deacetylase HST1 [Sugiyamaella lignohabitans]